MARSSLNKYIGMALGLYIGSMVIGGPAVGHALSLGFLPGPVPHGTLNCQGLERLWIKAGGNPGAARIAASIAMAESGGQQDATMNNTNGTTDRGYFQINSIWGALSTYVPIDNARAAVTISHDGQDWSPWVTYNTGAYQGRC